MPDSTRISSRGTETPQDPDDGRARQSEDARERPRSGPRNPPTHECNPPHQMTPFACTATRLDKVSGPCSHLARHAVFQPSSSTFERGCGSPRQKPRRVILGRWASFSSGLPAVRLCVDLHTVIQRVRSAILENGKYLVICMQMRGNNTRWGGALISNGSFSGARNLV